jgi:hypothetical protein
MRLDWKRERDIEEKMREKERRGREIGFGGL